MDTLLELAALLDKKRLTKIDVLDKTFLNKNNNDLYYQFYSGLLSGKFINDNIACQALYGIDRPDHRYRMLKSRLKNRLVKTFLLIDSESYFEENIKSKNYHECLTALNIIETLVKIQGTSKIVFDLIKDNYPQALKFRFYEILKIYSFYLLTYHGLSGNESEYNAEEQRYLQYVEFAQFEQKIKILNTRTLLFFSGQRPINNSLIVALNQHISEFEETIKRFPDPESLFYYYHSLIHYTEIKGDYLALLDECNKVDKLFQLHPHIESTSRKFLINVSRLKVFLYCKEYDKGIEFIQNYDFNIGHIGCYNWILTKEFEFKLNFNNNNITKCKNILHEVTTNKFFKRSYTHAKERWKIYEAFMVFMDSYLNKGDFKFPVAKFINSVPFYTKDKSGFNLTIRLIEILYLFGKKQYDIIFCKMDALKVYKTRYLNDDTYIRSRLFLNALFKAEKDGFNAKAMRKGYPEIEQLNNKEKQLIIADWEVIPYENLWEILTDLAKE